MAAVPTSTCKHKYLGSVGNNCLVQKSRFTKAVLLEAAVFALARSPWMFHAEAAPSAR